MAAMFGSHCGSYINYYKFETFLMSYKNPVDIFVGLVHEIVLCRCLKLFCAVNRGHFGKAAIATLKKSAIEPYQVLMSTYK